MATQKTTENKVYYVSPFIGNDVRPVPGVVLLDDSSTFCQKPVAKYVESDPGNALPDFSDQVKVQEIVNQSASTCGLAYALRQINQGRLMPAMIADDGKHSVDLTIVPDNINDAYEQSLEAAKKAAKVRSDLDLNYVDPANIEKYVSDAVRRQVQAYMVSQQASKEVKSNE